ncbi:endonuclease III, partial [Exiguobacterium chiriqhucha]|uniref:endonuclease III n=1 Tax=Exiguobacterium chiriqhucha TaxID=1385984 RepID=UPI0023EFFE18
MLTRAQLTEVSDTMRRMFPDAHCELTHRNPFELVVAVALSAQATDALVNKVTPGLFEAYPSVESMAAADVADIEALIKRIGLYRNKAKNVKALSMQIVERHDGIVPSDRESLEALPGVGRKTANVVLSVAFHEPAFAVDTHVERVSKRLGICRWKDNVRQVEDTLMKKIIAATCLIGAITLPALTQAREVTLTTQLKDYSGNDAYLAIYVTDANGQYQKTLW